MIANKIIKFFDNKSAGLKAKAKNTRDTAYFRATAYSRVSNILKESFGTNETLTAKKINSLPLTDEMKKKIIHYINNPKKLETDQKNESSYSKQKLLLRELTNYMGIGVTKAKELVDNGLTDVKQIKQKKYLKLLTDQTRVFLSLKPIKKIPHNEIKLLEPFLTGIMKQDKL